MAQEKRLLSMKEACRYLGVSRMTLIEAEERGLIAPERTLGGHRRYTVEELSGLLKRPRGSSEGPAPLAQPQATLQLTRFISDLHSHARAPDDALKEALRNLVLLLQMEMGAVYLCDGDGALRLQAAFGIPHWFLAAMGSVGGASLSGEVLRTRQPQVYDGRSRHDLPAQLEIGQGLCAPLIYRDEALGCVHIMARRQRQFFPSEISIVTTIAVYLAGMVVNTQLLEQVQSQLRELALLSQLSQAMETTADLDPLLEIFLDETLRLVGEGTGTIYLSDETGQHLYLKTGRGALDRLYQVPVRTDTGIIGWMFRHQQPYYSPCLREDPLLPAEFVEAVADLGTVSCLCLPMRTGNRIVGVFSINTARPRAFSPAEMRVLMTAAREAAVAIHRTRLLTAARSGAEEQRRLGDTYAAIFDRLSAAVAAVGESGAVVVWNQAFERLSGVPRARALGRDPRAAAPALAPVWAALDLSLADGEARAVDMGLPGGPARFAVRPGAGGAVVEAVAGEPRGRPGASDDNPA